MKRIQEPEVKVVKMEVLDIVTASEQTNPIGVSVVKSTAVKVGSDGWGF